ncbi:hypothetical protein ACU4GD_03795 [Cupriavidus basilensis]
MTGGGGLQPARAVRGGGCRLPRLGPVINLSVREAAALPLVFITAWEGLIDRARVQAGQKVLVHGGVGGVGQDRGTDRLRARQPGSRRPRDRPRRHQEIIEGYGATAINPCGDIGRAVCRSAYGRRRLRRGYDTVGGAVLDSLPGRARTYGGRV